MSFRNSIIYDVEKICEYLSSKSETATNLIKENIEWEYMLIIKNITHSDLLNSGKRNGPNETLDKNYLYYLSISEMNEIEGVRKKKFENAKQSNIFMPSDFYKFLDMPQLERRSGAQTSQHEHPIINDYADVYLVNDSLKYFNIDYTKKVFQKLGKNPTNWDYDKYKYSYNGEFTPIQITHAIHGIGTSDDEMFKKIRRSIFKSDTLNVLLRKNRTTDEKEVYIILEKNPRFFTLIGECNEAWEKYLKQISKNDLFVVLQKDIVGTEEDKNRKRQNKWRNMLADEMMSYTTTDDEIFCPLTYITANFSSVGTLFRASHIKAFKECTPDEAFDINNGILMVANADALFDKHLITISDDGEIIFSFLLKNEHKLIQELRLTEKVFKAILNNSRKKYLAVHREIFSILEEKRRSNEHIEDENISA